MSETKPIQSLPKEAVRGSVHLEFKKCGCRSCRCSSGTLHGPYFYRRWRDGTRQRKEYVRTAEVPNVLYAIEMARSNKTTLREVRLQFRRLNSERF